MPGDDDLSLIVAAAEAAGGIAARHFGTPVARSEKPDGQGPVSEADLEIDAMLRARLQGARPGYGWLSEESPDGPDRLAAGRVFVADPLDGTRAFLAGDRGFAHAIAVVEGGIALCGVVHLPLLGLTYAARRGGGATRNGAPVRASARTEPEGARALTGAQQLRPELWPGGPPAVERHFRPSLAARLCLVADGSFDALITFRDVWEWDAAAGGLVAEEAGATVTTPAGEALRFNRAPPLLPGLLVAPPALHAALRARL